jgi:hypothetical protein
VRVFWAGRRRSMADEPSPMETESKPATPTPVNPKTASLAALAADAAAAADGDGGKPSAKTGEQLEVLEKMYEGTLPSPAPPQPPWVQGKRCRHPEGSNEQAQHRQTTHRPKPPTTPNRLLAYHCEPPHAQAASSHAAQQRVDSKNAADPARVGDIAENTLPNDTQRTEMGARIGLTSKQVGLRNRPLGCSGNTVGTASG